jgi:hypothetical protein
MQLPLANDALQLVQAVGQGRGSRLKNFLAVSELIP